MTNDTFQVAGSGAAIYESHASLFMKPFVDALVETLMPASRTTVLDVACGTGFVARHLISTVPDIEVVGVDMNPQMIEGARQLAPKVTWKVANADQLPIEDSSVDAVVVQQGMQFFGDLDAVAAEFMRVTKSRAKVVATVWAGLDTCPYFAAQSSGLAAFIDSGAARDVRHAVSSDNAGNVGAALERAKFDNVESSLIEANVVLPAVGNFAVEQLSATPWQSLFQAASSSDRESFREHMATELSAYKTDAGWNVPFASHLVVAERS